MRHVSFDQVKIKGGHDFAKRVKLEGPIVLFSKLGAKIASFANLEGQKCILAYFLKEGKKVNTI